MNVLTDPFTVATYPDLFTLMWVAGIAIAIGAIVVYNLAQRRYRRYPEILALHEWIFWPIIVTWGVIPLLVVIGVPLLLQLVAIFTGMGIAAYAAFVKFPPRIEAANDDIRRRRYVPPPRREERSRPKPTPAGRRRRHR
jgi:Na+-driven multidrug efflux pump